MRVISGCAAVVAAASLLASGPALAVPFSATGVSTISPCPSFCGGPGGQSSFDLDNSPNQTFSSSGLDVTDGVGNAQTNFVGASLLPELKAEAFSNTSPRTSRVQSTATGMQQYDYSGLGRTITLGAVVDAVIDVGSDPRGDAEATGRIVVFLTNGVDPGQPTDYATLVFETIPLTPGLALLGDGTDQQTLTETGTTNLSVSFDVEDGDSLFVWSQLSTFGYRGGSADAFDTMTLAFDDPTGLVPVLGSSASPLPAPATLSLLALGCLGLGGRRRGTA